MTPVEHAPALRRGYTECRYGQLHYLESHPTAATANIAAFATATAVTAELATPLVLLHQNPSSSEEYRGLVAEMAKDRRILAFDTPGSGMSEWPSSPQSMEALAAAFADGLDALGYGANGGVDVFGYHTGTLLAAELAIARPALVRRVVLCGIPFRSPEECAERLAAVRRTPPLSDDGAAVLAQLAALWRYVVADRLAAVPLRRAAELFIEKAKPLDRFWWPYEGVWSYAVTARFPLIHQPVLVLQPWEDLLEQSRRATALLPRGHWRELPSLSRDIFEVGIAELAAGLRDFLVQ